MFFHRFPIGRIGIMSLLLISLISCGPLVEPGGVFFNFKVAQIESLKNRQKLNSTVYIQGTVETYAPFWGTTAYQVRDNSGTIWVFTTNGVPGVGTEILIKGKLLYQSIQVEGLAEDLGEFYLEEIQQLTPETDDQPSE